MTASGPLRALLDALRIEGTDQLLLPFRGTFSLFLQIPINEAGVSNSMCVRRVSELLDQLYYLRVNPGLGF